jgi:hypothetical protein
VGEILSGYQQLAREWSLPPQAVKDSWIFTLSIRILVGKF